MITLTHQLSKVANPNTQITIIMKEILHIREFENHERDAKFKTHLTPSYSSSNTLWAAAIKAEHMPCHMTA